MATIEGTRRLLARAVERGALHQANVRLLPRSELSCSAVGFGAYRVGGGGAALESQHIAAVRAALRCGVNLVDTSAHYAAKSEGAADGGHGLSERLIGQALYQAVEAGEVCRDGVVVCTKLGHVARGRLPPESSVPVSPHLGSQDDWHSIDPIFVEEEVLASRERLGTPPDFVLLHNPEYFLSEQLRKRVKIADAWEHMYDKLEQAFRKLEDLCDQGVIGAGYGVSGNFLSCLFSTTGRPNVYEALALDRVLDAAAVAAGGKETHRFRLAQMPVNIIESGAVLGRGEVVAEAAEGDCELGARLGIGIIANRPLNAIPPPGVSSGDWGRSGQSHIRLKDATPMDPIQALLKRVLAETLAEDGCEDVDWNAMPLQQMAMLLSMSTPGLSCCLVGSRTERYVNDVSVVLQMAPVGQHTVHRAMERIRSAMAEVGGVRRGLW